MRPGDFFNRFILFIHEHQLLQEHEPALLAVSGGVDSVVLSKLFSLAAFPFSIAHCNFRLRGKDADDDQKFAEQLAATYKVPFFTETFDTERSAKESGISIEMAARELRYAWLEKIRKENGYHRIALAHHRDDSIETVLLNLVKGTGISGLHGILPQRDKLVRPMLCFGKDEIEAYAKDEQLVFRQDATNFESVFQRNLLRNEVIPKLKQINPSFSETFAANIEKFKDAEALYKKGLTFIKKRLIERRGEDQFISIKKLLLIEGHRTILFELLKEFGFNEKQTIQVFDGLNDDSTKQYFSEKHRLVQERGFLIITTKEEEQSGIILINNINKTYKLPSGVLSFHLMTGGIIKAGDNSACIDFDKLQLPLTLRRWKQGDYFYPYGMSGKKKKLSDFFTDNKMSRMQKEQAWVLLSGDKIVWIVGHRIDERFKITEATKRTLILKWDKT